MSTKIEWTDRTWNPLAGCTVISPGCTHCYAMRMLTIPELLRCQGFPDTYQMVGNQADRKKYIGNSVVPLLSRKIGESMAESVFTPYLKQA